jgi:tetratricopeptide (TPR) repeat protein
MGVGVSTDLLDALERFDDPIAFERLACDVLHRAGYPGLDPQGTGRRDAGKDALVSHRTLGRVVFHFSLRRDWKRKLQEDVATVSQHGHACEHFVFATSRRASASDKDRMKQLVGDKLGASLEIFDQERFRIVLAAEPALCEAYFPNVVLPGSALQRLAAVLESLVEKGLIVPSSDQLAALPDVLDETGNELLQLASYGRTEEAMAKVGELAMTAGQVVVYAAHHLLAVGAVLFTQGRIAEARRCFGISTILKSDFFEGWFNLAVAREFNAAGHRYGHGMDHEGALGAFDKAFGTAPDDDRRAAVLDSRAVLLAKRDADLTEAVATLARARLLDPTNLSIRRNWTVLALTGDDQKLALLELLDTEERDFARLNLAKIAIDAEDWDAAASWIDGVDEREDVPYVDRLRIEIALGAGEVEHARTLAEDLVLRDETDPWTHSQLGMIALRQGENSTAVSAFERLVELTPTNPAAHMQLGRAMYNQGSDASLRRATSELEEYVRLEPHEAIGHLELGRCYESRGMLASARVEYVRATELDPSYVVAHFNLGYLTEFRPGGERIPSMDKAREALPYYLKALAIDRSYYPALVNAGTDYVILDDLQQGIDLLERARELDSDEPTMLCNLALGYAKAGELERAGGMLAKVLQNEPNNVFATELLSRIREA